MLHPSEMKKKDAASLAGRIAVKEACRKVFPDSSWLDFEVTYRKDGKPLLKTEHNFEGDISISHDGDYAIAVVIQK